ncbi:hypothetical protein EUGRSUZ_E01387 [Eucalyptus grandis]|uniref:Uncharacterized protein n=2 Tax=Eucalyptus grandis TaxID=71139 RepID=A0ACC3KUB5_EUCGR|nr:hypothetical protein EUGRSUZ_E01387 [Eucalyptus grandis]
MTCKHAPKALSLTSINILHSSLFSVAPVTTFDSHSLSLSLHQFQFSALPFHRPPPFDPFVNHVQSQLLLKVNSRTLFLRGGDREDSPPPE